MLAEIADGAGGVVLGRAAALVLRDRPDALHVRLDGPPRAAAGGGGRRGRAGRCEEVRREMEANDRAREAYVRHFYRCDPPRRRSTTTWWSTAPRSRIDTVVELVVTAARGRGIGSL